MVEKASYASTANGQYPHGKALPELDADAEHKPIEYMDVTALMNMLDKNRSQQPDDGETIVLEPAQKQVSAVIKELALELPKQPLTEVKAEPKSVNKSTAEAKAESKKAAAAVNGTAKKKKSSAKAKPEVAETAAPAIKDAPKEGKNSAKDATKDIPVPASVAVARLQVDRNTARHSRELQIKTQTNSRRISPMEDAIAPVEYATVATLMAVAVAVLVAILYLINDKGEIVPAEATAPLQQTVVRDGSTSKNGQAAAPKPSSQDAVEQDLLKLLNR